MAKYAKELDEDMEQKLKRFEKASIKEKEEQMAKFAEQLDEDIESKIEDREREIEELDKECEKLEKEYKKKEKIAVDKIEKFDKFLNEEIKGLDKYPKFFGKNVFKESIDNLKKDDDIKAVANKDYREYLRNLDLADAFQKIDSPLLIETQNKIKTAEENYKLKEESYKKAYDAHRAAEKKQVITVSYLYMRVKSFCKPQ